MEMVYNVIRNKKNKAKLCNPKQADRILKLFKFVSVMDMY